MITKKDSAVLLVFINLLNKFFSNNDTLIPVVVSMRWELCIRTDEFKGFASDCWFALFLMRNFSVVARRIEVGSY